MHPLPAPEKRREDRDLSEQSGKEPRQFGSIVPGVFTPVLAKHSKSFSIGMNSYANSFFAITTMAVGVPTGIKIFNWIGTMWGGKIQFKVPMLFCIGFLFQFLIAGLTGIMQAAAPFDWQLSLSYFVVAHFHRIKRISKFPAACETNLVCFAGYRERAAQSAMPAAKKEVPDSLWRFEHQHSGGVIPLDRSKTMTKHRSLLAKSMNASREYSTPCTWEYLIFGRTESTDGLAPS
jgi:hypothetical protein